MLCCVCRVLSSKLGKQCQCKSQLSPQQAHQGCPGSSQWPHTPHWLACIDHSLGRDPLSVSMVDNYKAKIHAHSGSCSEVWEVVVVDPSRGVGLPRGDVVIMAVSGLIPVCPCDEVCCQAQAGELELRQPGPGAGLGRSLQQCAGVVQVREEEEEEGAGVTGLPWHPAACSHVVAGAGAGQHIKESR